MILRTTSDYTLMPWANGRGVTTEMIRVDRDGTLDWRLSMAQVVEDGPFSCLPGVQRNLTVIEGPGFDLVAPGLHLRAGLLQPVAFSGDVRISATGVTGPSVDFNVMTAGRTALVRVVHGAQVLQPAGTTLCVLALDLAGYARHDLLISNAPIAVQGLGLAVWIG